MAESDRGPSLSGLTDAEAQEFHGFFMSSTMIYVAIAIVAHILVWMWRPWIPGPEGYQSSMMEKGTDCALQLMTLIA